MLAGSVRWSVHASTRTPAAAAARTFSSNVDVPSENDVCVWQSTIAVGMGLSLAKRAVKPWKQASPAHARARRPYTHRLVKKHLGVPPWH